MTLSTQIIWQMGKQKINRMIWGKCFFIRVLLLHIVLLISYTEGLLQGHYIGCFKLAQFASARYSMDQLTVENCISKCSAQRTTYVAIQNETICECISDYGIQLPDDACNIICAGKRLEYRGGESDSIMKSSIYSASVVYTVCPVGNYGLECNQVCHCKQQIPCDRMTGNCFNECDGNYTGSSCNITSLRDQYVGCYKDNSSSRALSPAPYVWDHSNTLEKCTTSCANANFSYSGAQFASECFCGETYDKYKILEETKCDRDCPGNRQQICGGSNANSIYSVCPIGRFGIGCREKCNCLNNNRCIYQNGSCPSNQCTPGWTGTSCNIRDCTANNGDCDRNETCTEVDHKFHKISVCRCSVGFHRQNIWENCTDKDECFQIPSLCGENALNCTNTNGGYQCVCSSGQTRLNMPCITEDPKASNIGFIVGAVLISLLCFFIILVVYLYRHKWQMLFQKKHGCRHPRNAATDISSREIEIGSCEQDRIYYSSPSVPIEINRQQLPHLIKQKLSTTAVIEKEFKSVSMDSKEPCNFGKKRDLKKKNRFKNVIPYDHNRVILSKVDGNALSDYINASYIRGYNASDKFIATQGPRPESVGDFWRMVCEKEVNVIVMITGLVENQKVKCEKYWPKTGERVEYEGIAVRTTNEEYWNDFALRQFQVTKNSQTLTVKQWNFLSWPDHGVPLDVNSFHNFHRKVRQSMKTGKYTIVHCSAGVGRTGCFIAIDFLLEQGNAEGRIDVLGCLQALREQRTQMIQTLEQYRFVHAVLLRHFSIGDTTIPTETFHQKLRELQQNDPENGRCKLDVQFYSLEETKEKLAGKSNTFVTSKSIHKNKIAEMDAAFVQGWKKKNAYITLTFPAPTAIQDFYTLCREYRCKVVIFLDSEQASLFPIFPTKENEISLRSHTVSCDRMSTTDYGTCYKLSERKQSDETYANLAHLAIYANVGGEPNTREIHVFHLSKSLTKDAIHAHSLIALHKDICSLNTTECDSSPIVVLSKTGYSLTTFCLAAFIAFDMMNDENEVDIYQIVQDTSKSRTQFEFTLATYKALYAVISQYIEQGINSV